MGGWRTRGRTTSTRCTWRSAPPGTAQRRSRSTSAGPTPRSPTRPTGSPPRADAPVQLSGGGPPRATPLPARGQLLNSWEAHPSTCATAFIYTHACRNVFFLINSRSADRGRYVLHCSTQQLVSRSILLLNLIPSSLSSSGAYYVSFCPSHRSACFENFSSSMPFFFFFLQKSARELPSKFIREQAKQYFT
jgi:hypothetical protein